MGIRSHTHSDKSKDRYKLIGKDDPKVRVKKQIIKKKQDCADFLYIYFKITNGLMFINFLREITNTSRASKNLFELIITNAKQTNKKLLKGWE